MQNQRRLSITFGVAMTVLSSAAVSAMAQQATVEGMVIGRDGPSMMVRTADSPRTTVLLSDSTKATEKGGFLGWSKHDLGIAALVPGLSVKVEGSYNADHQLVANKVTFSSTSYNTAKSIDAGLNPVNEQLGAQQDQLRSNRRDLDSQQAMLQQHGQDIDAAKQGLAQNSQAIGQTNDRIGTLDQFDTKDSLTINFANGRSTVSAKDKDQLTEFAKTVANTPGAMIEVQGYASSVGSAAVNQRLSAERAENVLTIIQQSGAVPLTRILAPAAMGTTNAVATGRSRSAQAQNRRVVVTIVVNKGIAQQIQQAQS